MAPACENRSIAFTKIGKQRLDAKRSQKELADLADISVPVLQRLEAGRIANPGIITLLKLAMALNCSLDALIEDGWKAGKPISPPKVGEYHSTRQITQRDRRQR